MPCMDINKIRNKFSEGGFSIFSFFKKDRTEIQPQEFGNVISSLPHDISLSAFTELSHDTQVKVFPYLDVQHQQHIIRNFSKHRINYLLTNLSTDDRVKILSCFKGIEQTKYLDLLDDAIKMVTHDFLGYPENSVARLVNTEFATVSADMTVEEATQHLRQFHKDTETADVIYVTDNEGKLIDDVPVRKFVLTAPQKQVGDILDGFCATLLITDPKETAISMFKEYDRVVLPVVNAENILIGVITIDDVLDVAEEQDTKEMQKFGGLESLDFPYVKTPFFSLIKKRAGWLVILFVGEMLTATAMGYFDTEISKAVVLALFVPLIISSGGNSGSQAATLIIRAMALKELSFKDWWYVMKREILSGFTLGCVLGSIGFVRIVLWQNLHLYNYSTHYILVAFTIFLSLIGIVMWGTLSGSMIPIVLKRAGLDPAASSAPFVATLVDVTGLVIYFSIAAVILRGTLL